MPLLFSSEISCDYISCIIGWWNPTIFFEPTASVSFTGKSRWFLHCIFAGCILGKSCSQFPTHFSLHSSMFPRTLCAHISEPHSNFHCHAFWTSKSFFQEFSLYSSGQFQLSCLQIDHFSKMVGIDRYWDDNWFSRKKDDDNIFASNDSERDLKCWLGEYQWEITGMKTLNLYIFDTFGIGFEIEKIVLMIFFYGIMILIMTRSMTCLIISYFRSSGLFSFLFLIFVAGHTNCDLSRD
jgi:hypothetical protein